jgi:Zn finger protein HypA/HybF involved in hydrogenase expression
MAKKSPAEIGFAKWIREEEGMNLKGIKVVCLECDKKFTTTKNALPECPKCGGTDIDVR